MSECEFDELKVYRGDDMVITDDIVVKQPTIAQIADFGERKYFSAVHTLTAVGADLKWQLCDYAGIDYTEIDDYELFVKFISQLVSSRKKIHKELVDNPEYAEQLDGLSEDELDAMLVNPLELTLNIDLADFIPCMNNDAEQVVLYDVEHDITIDRPTYIRMVGAVRQIHGFKRNNEMPANEITKMDLIDDAREEAMRNANKPYKSILKPLISALSVKTGMCGDKRIWDMPVGMFFDSIKRANKIQDSQLLLQGAYSGFASLKGVDSDRLNWTGDI